MGVSRASPWLIITLLLLPALSAAEVVRVSIDMRTTVANGQVFGAVGPYEKLAGTIEFALDPTDPRNAPIVDLQHAARAADGRVHFTADVFVLRPVDAARGNGVLLFEIANRGNKSMIPRFNSAPAAADPMAPADFGNGFLMREGYTLVWVGWEFDVQSGIRVQAPAAAGIVDTISVRFTPNQWGDEAILADAPAYPPADPDDPASRLTVRDRFWDPPAPIVREQWSFLPRAGAPALRLQGGFEPGRLYEVTYKATGAVVAGVGLAAIRDAASAFRYRTDLPIQGRATYVFGASQSGRFLRQFLHDGFNADERGRRVFDAVWPHIAGAARGSFNERFATPTSLSLFVATRFPYAEQELQAPDGGRDGLLAKYRPEQLPNVIHTETSVEYWGGGRAAALAHTTPDGRRDLSLPDNVRIYLLASTQHGQAPFPPRPGQGQQLPNPVPQSEVMRALLRGLHQWVADGVAPPASRYPRLDDGTLTAVGGVRFPSVSGVRDPRTIPGPGAVTPEGVRPLPFLVPQVDSDGNELAGIRVPDVDVPLASTTGWNFRAERIGNPADIVPLLGSYIPFARTRAERDVRNDPRPSIEERYANREAYLRRIRAAADTLMQGRYLLGEDVDNVLARARAHWDYATRSGTDAAARAHPNDRQRAAR